MIEYFNLHPDVCHPDDHWDLALLRELTAGDFGPVGDAPVVVVPGRHHVGDETEFNQWLRARFPFPPLVAVTSDEANEFDVDAVDTHRIWVQTIRPGRFARSYTPLPLGWPTGTRATIRESGWARPRIGVYFSGQVTHRRREEMVEAFGGVGDHRPRDDVSRYRYINATAGFTQGHERSRYLRDTAAAHVVPCPSGPVMQETFRMWEALLAGAVPILDAKTPDSGDDGYWQLLFRGQDHPLPIIQEWDDAPAVADEIISGWPHTQHRVVSWFIRYVRQLARDLNTDVAGTEPAVTVLIPTSPIPSHPSTDIIEQTYRSVRERMPDADVRIMVDGIRPEQHHYYPSYQDYVSQLLWKAVHEWSNVTVTVHDVHRHQAAMTRSELLTVATPVVLFVEHDTPLVGEWPVGPMVDIIQSGAAHLIRMNHEHAILDEHRHLHPDRDVNFTSKKLPMTRTRMWSQRPHLASTRHYLRWLQRWFTADARSMIEDRMHSVVQTRPWEEHKMWLYVPDGNQQRSIHIDGRGTDPKYPMTY